MFQPAFVRTFTLFFDESFGFGCFAACTARLFPPCYVAYYITQLPLPCLRLICNIVLRVVRYALIIPIFRYLVFRYVHLNAPILLWLA